MGYIGRPADIVEGMAALHGWGRAARAIADCSGVVPVVFTVTGPAVSGPALLLGLADHVVMTEDAYAFVSGPTMVAEFTGVVVDADELGGASAHARFSGAASLVVPDRDAAESAVADLLWYLRRTRAAPGTASADPGADRPERHHPEAATGSHDISTSRAIVDGDGCRAGAGGPQPVTALATIGGRPVGILNQPTALAGTLDIPASQKGARSPATPSTFDHHPVDTPGFTRAAPQWRG